MDLFTIFVRFKTNFPQRKWVLCEYATMENQLTHCGPVTPQATEICAWQYQAIAWTNVDWSSVKSLRWRHNGGDSVSNHQPNDCLLDRLFGRRSKSTSKPRVTGLCVGNSPWTGEFPAQRASYAENVSIWWRHYVQWHIRAILEEVPQPSITKFRLKNTYLKFHINFPLANEFREYRNILFRGLTTLCFSNFTCSCGLV